MVSVKEVGLYWNDQFKNPIPINDFEVFRVQMKDLINTPNLLAKSHYIMSPISTSVAIQSKRKKNQDNYSLPGKLISVLFETVEINLNEIQLRQIYNWKERVELYRIRKKYRKIRPLKHIIPASDPIQYWKFIIQAHLKPIQKKRKLLNPKWLTERRTKRLRYMALWEQKILNPKFISQELDELEKQLSYDDIAYFRSLKEAEMNIEKIVNPPKKSQSWWSWGSYLNNEPNDIQEHEIIEEDVHLSIENRETFLEILNLTENVKNPHDLPIEVNYYYLNLLFTCKF